MEKSKQQKNVLVVGWLLAISALLGTGLVAVVNWHSRPYIAENERLEMLRSLSAVIPPASYTNDILQGAIKVVDKKLLGTDKASTVYRARKAGRPVAVALTAVAPNGYTGPIVLLVGIDYEGTITGVRVVKHRETPGLGDGIEKERSNWIDGFIGKSSEKPAPRRWKVKRDGGDFDQLTGATITPRAVVGAVQKALQYFKKNRERLFAEPVPAELMIDLTKPQR